LDKRIAIIGAVGFACVGTALLVRVSQPLYGASSLLACAACIGYLLLRRRVTLRVDATDSTDWYDTSWLAAWSTAILVYAIRPEPYERPLAFFILIALSCGAITAKIIRCRLSGKDMAITLAQTVAVGLSLVWTVTLMYPSLIGLDPWTHQAIVLNGIDAGSWSAYPMWHRVWYSFIALIMETTGLEYRLAAMSVSFLQVAAGATLLFLIGRRVAGTRAGLLAALVLSFSSWHIFFGFWTIPNGLGLSLLLLAVYLVVEHGIKGGRWPVCALVVTVPLLLLTYPLAVIWLTTLLCIWVTLSLIKGYRLPGKRIALPLTIIGVTVSLSWKIGFFSQIHDLLFMYKLDPGRTGGTQLPGLIPSQAGTFFIDTIANPSWESAFNASGMVLGFVLAIAGCLWLLSKHYRKAPSALVVLSFGFFLAVGIIPALFGMSVIEHRWWYAAQAFGAIPAAIALMTLHRPGRGVIVPVGVIMLSFLMMIGLPCNMDNDTFSKNQLARYALTQGELDAAKWTLDKYEGNIGVDNYYTFANNLLSSQDHRFVGINKEILSNDYSTLNCSLVLVRDAIAYEPFALGEGRVYKLLYDPNVALTEYGYRRVYSADGVNGYIKWRETRHWTR
jgi:hypothetical protein